MNSVISSYFACSALSHPIRSGIDASLPLLIRLLRADGRVGSDLENPEIPRIVCHRGGRALGPTETVCRTISRSRFSVSAGSDK
jgi:hypothetical protein